MSQSNDRPHVGRLLVATPDLTDGHFAKAVVLVLEHSDEGALGVVLNQPRNIEAAALLPGWGSKAARPSVLFTGGPVQADEAVIGLAQGASQGPDILPGISVLDLSHEPEAAPDVAAVRLFVGYAGWAQGQLDSELEAGGWFVVDADPADVFTDEPGELWRTVLYRQGGVFRAVTDDPTLN